MNVQTLLSQQFGAARGVLQETMADLRPEDLQRTLPGATIASIGHIYAHVVHGEDALLHGMILGQAPLWVTGGYAERTGLGGGERDHMDATLYDRMAELDPALFQAYAEATFAATDAYLASAGDEEMDRVVETGFMGAMPVAAILANVLVSHIVEHTGEIAALKGVFGRKGLPF